MTTKAMQPAKLRRLMTAPPATAPARDPAVARVLLRYREAVAVATERAYREMDAVGVDESGTAR